MPFLQRVLSYSESNVLKGSVEQTKSKQKYKTKECSAHCMYHETLCLNIKH